MMLRYDKWLRYGKEAIEKCEFNNLPAVYVVYLNERLSYIGQTNDFKFRMISHQISYWKNCFKTKWGCFADVYIKVKFTSKFGKEAMIEKRLINRLKPGSNC